MLSVKTMAQASVWALGGYGFAAGLSDSIAFSLEGGLLTIAGALLTGVFFTVAHDVADYFEKQLRRGNAKKL